MAAELTVQLHHLARHKDLESGNQARFLPNHQTTTLMPKPKEQPSVMLVLEGWKIDAFICEDGATLGMTVERCTPDSPVLDPDEPSVDIFVDTKLNVVSA